MQLQHHQVTTAERIVRSKTHGIVIAHDMGTGKTLTALEAARNYLNAVDGISPAPTPATRRRVIFMLPKTNFEEGNFIRDMFVLEYLMERKWTPPGMIIGGANNGQDLFDSIMKDLEATSNSSQMNTRLATLRNKFRTFRHKVQSDRTLVELKKITTLLNNYLVSAAMKRDDKTLKIRLPGLLRVVEFTKHVTFLQKLYNKAHEKMYHDLYPIQATYFDNETVKRCDLDNVLLIVDEAHHFQARYTQMIWDMESNVPKWSIPGIESSILWKCATSAQKVVLMTGTPFSNSYDDIKPTMAMCLRLPLNKTVLLVESVFKPIMKYYKISSWVAANWRTHPTKENFPPILIEEFEEIFKGNSDWINFKCLFDIYKIFQDDLRFPKVDWKWQPVIMEGTKTGKAYLETQTKGYPKSEARAEGGSTLIRSIKDLHKDQQLSLSQFQHHVRQASNQYWDNDIQGFPSNKMVRLTNDLDEFAIRQKQRTLVYSFFLNSGLKMIHDHLLHQGIEHGVISGDEDFMGWYLVTTSEQQGTFDVSVATTAKADIINRYNETPGAIVLLSSAGSEGISFKFTQHIIVTEPTWHYAALDQLTARGIRLDSHPEQESQQNNIPRLVTIHSYIADIEDFGSLQIPNELLVNVKDTDPSSWIVPPDPTDYNKIRNLTGISRLESDFGIDRVLQLLMIRKLNEINYFMQIAKQLFSATEDTCESTLSISHPNEQLSTNELMELLKAVFPTDPLKFVESKSLEMYEHAKDQLAQPQLGGGPSPLPPPRPVPKGKKTARSGRSGALAGMYRPPAKPSSSSSSAAGRGPPPLPKPSSSSGRPPTAAPSSSSSDPTPPRPRPPPKQTRFM